MSRAQQNGSMTVEEFPQWSLSQDERYELFEVLLPTTRQIDRSVKRLEYQRHPSLRVIGHTDPDVMDVIVLPGDAKGMWDHARLNQPEHTILVPDTSPAVNLGDLYEGVLPADNAARA